MKVKSNVVKNFLTEQRISLLLIAICVLLQFINSNFLSFGNIISVLIRYSIEFNIVIAITFVIILGEIDLSVGAIMSISCFSSIFFQRYGVATGLIAGILTGTLVGLVNGLIIIKFKTSSIPITLGMSVLINGLVFVLTKGNSINGTNSNFKFLTDYKIFNIPTVIIIAIVMILIFDFILKKTIYGRCLYACGGNIKAAEYAGINVKLLKLSIFIISGFLSGVAGVLTASRLNMTSGLLGVQTTLIVITGAFIGGVSLSGGEGTVVKAAQGLLFMAVLNNAIQFLKFPNALQDVILGSLLIIILIIDAINIKKKKYI